MIILIVVILAGVIFFKLQEGDNPKLKRGSKKTRIMGGAIALAAIAGLIFNTTTGGIVGEERNNRLMVFAIIFAIVAVLIPLLIRWRDERRNK